MNRMRNEDGFTLVETVVVFGLLSVIAVGFYSVMFSASRGSDTTRSVATISEEARLGLNRLVRDTREADTLTNLSPTGYSVKVDFDGDGDFENTPGNYEVLDFKYDDGANAMLLNGEVLIKGVDPIAGEDIFSYSSNRLEYDTDGNGITTLQELAVADGAGILKGAPESFISSVDFAFQVSAGSHATAFHTQAQIRNRR